MTHSNLPSNLFPRAVGRWFIIAALTVMIFLLAGCAQTGDMDTQPRYDPLAASSFFPDGRSARPIETGTVPMTGGDLSPNSPILTGLDQNGQPYKGFPEPVTQDLVKLGQERYNIYCIPCHGPSGQGDGKVIAFGFPKPANLLSDTVKSMSNGEIFGVIENGKGKMFSYGYRVKPQERWAVIAYVRAMELKNGTVNPSDLTPDQLNQLGK